MIEAIIFDVDGVLLDSFESNLEFYEQLFAKVGFNPPTREFLEENHNLSVWEMIGVITAIEDELEKRKIMNLVKELDYVPKHNSKLMSGALEVIETLSKEFKLGIVSSRMREHIFETPLTDLQDYFTVVIGFEDVSQHKPDPEPLLKAAEMFSVETKNCVYIGDMQTDIQAANAAGMHSIHYSTNPDLTASAYTDDFYRIPGIVRDL